MIAYARITEVPPELDHGVLGTFAPSFPFNTMAHESNDDPMEVGGHTGGGIKPNATGGVGKVDNFANPPEPEKSRKMKKTQMPFLSVK